MNEIVIKLPNLVQLADDGKKLVFDPKAENAIVALFDHQTLVENTIEFVKTEIEKTGLATLPGFKSVSSDKIRAVRQISGYKYFLHENIPVDKLVELGLVKEKRSYSIDSEAVDAYIEKTGELPQGISANNREPKMQLTTKKPKIKKEDK